MSNQPNTLTRVIEIIEAFKAFKEKGLVDYEVKTRTVLIDEWLWNQLDHQKRIAWVENATVWVAGQQPNADPEKETLHNRAQEQPQARGTIPAGG